MPHGLRAVVCALAIVCVGPTAFARGGGHSHSSGHSSSHAAHTSPSHAGSHAGTNHAIGSGHSASSGKSHSGSRAATGAQRDSHGKIERSTVAKNSFKKNHPCPSTGRASGACPGYVIDHLVPLKRGGRDAPSNMQWQTNAAASAKDKTE